MKATYKKYTLHFKQPSGTSRGILKIKETWFLLIEENNKRGVGECGMFKGLSIDDVPDYENKLQWVCANIQLGFDKLYQELEQYPSIQFGLEQAFLMLNAKRPFELFSSSFTEGVADIPINGLIWMGEETFMKTQIENKLQEGYTCIKMKIGAIDFNTEIKLLKSIRKDFDSNQIEIRVDANGAFHPDTALEKLKRLSELDLHSIEQPVRQGQIDTMAALCLSSPLPIALDEELIGVFNVTKKEELLQMIQPHYIILKPTLVGGYKASDEWITIAEKHKIGWWITSALESNIGLNAIAQWAFIKQSKMPQGLGTGALFKNNFKSPLRVKNGRLLYNPLEKIEF